ncbi:MAG: Dabb family protein, partial [Spirochaetales bacterium]|nr:Dabb family protein [Spirochaetales bacterium]
RAREVAMIAHVVCWKLKDSALGKDKSTNRTEMEARLKALLGVVPELRRLDVSTTVVNTTEDFDIVLYTEFDDVPALDAYRVHPDHKRVAEFIGEVTESRVAVDYEV